MEHKEIKIDPCPLHFGDWTAHETVQRFLSELPKFDNLTTEKRLAFDDFCEGLNSVYFIDCLRDELKKDEVKQKKTVFKNIERIAKEFKEENKWKKFPNLSILLLSIARTPLENQGKEFTRDALLRGVREIYDHFNEESESCNSDSLCRLCDERLSQNVKDSDFCESRYLVFRAGCQLLPFQDENADWKNWRDEFAAFGRQYSEEISKFRMLYYSTDNITVFIHRIVERWKRMSDSTAKEGDFTAQEFKDLDNKYYDLNPLRFELPVQSRGAEAFKFANDFIQKFEKPKANKQTIGKDFVRKLANRFRIIQWEILVRDLVAEAGGNRLCFHPISVAHTISGMPDDGDFLTNFINDTRKIECRFEPSYGEIPTKERYNEGRSPKGKIILDENQTTEVKECLESFEILLPETPNRYYFIHEDLVKSFANVRASDKSTNKSFNTMLIEDGELSFFSLLWLLRYARWIVDKAVKDENSKEKWESKLKEWRSVEENGELTTRFRLRPKESSPGPFEDNWSECNMQEFAEECGLIILLKKNDQTGDNEVPFQGIRTRRWTSLITWLRRLNDNLKDTREPDEEYLQDVKKLYYDNPLLKRLPIKILDYGKKRTSFIKNLRKFLASKDLTDMLGKLDKSLSDTSATYEKFTEKFIGELGDLVKSLDKYSLLEVESSAGLDDKVLLRCCRGFIPIEHLIRAYKPCEFHLLFQALNWEESHPGDSKQAPISIGCATIAGQVETEPMGKPDKLQETTIGGVETDPDSRDDSESSEVTITDFDRWVDPYRTLFSTLSTNFVLPAVKKSGEQTQKQYFAHQTSRLLGTVWLDPERKHLAPESRFALWLAKTHATEIWGNFPVDVNKKIYDEDFPDWQGHDARQIVEGLLDFGLRGGVARAASPPKSNVSMFSEEWQTENKVSEYAKGLERRLRRTPDEVKDAIEEVRLSLSFSVPETSPPAWVTTSAFAMCFYHGLRQSVYHALRTFVIIDKKKGQPCLWIDWDADSVSIYNQGMGIEKYLRQGSVTTDREFFEIFESKAVEEKNGKNVKVFKIDGPEPASNSKVPDIWRFVIRRLKSHG